MIIKAELRLNLPKSFSMSGNTMQAGGNVIIASTVMLPETPPKGLLKLLDGVQCFHFHNVNQVYPSSLFSHPPALTLSVEMSSSNSLLHTTRSVT
jgi:hypothetical protein